jgi:hypothetical protein
MAYPTMGKYEMAIDGVRIDVRELAEAVMTCWELAGGECEHGVGSHRDCDPDCPYQPVRPAVRRAANLARPDRGGA